MVNVAVDNFRNSYILKAGTSDTRAIQKRLDDMAGNLVAGECDKILSSAWPDDSGIRIIRRLPVNLTLDIKEIDAPSTSRIWAESIAGALSQALRPPYDRSNIMVFSNLSEYLASFLSDLLRGVARARWYYQEFETLQKLDTKEIINEVLKNNQLIAEDIILILMERNCLSNLFEELNPDDIENIYENYLDAVPRYGHASYRELVPRLMGLVNESVPDIAAGELPDYKNYLILFLRAVKKYPDLRNVSLLRNAVKIAFLLQRFLVKSSQQEGWGRIVALQDSGSLRRIMQNETGERRSGLLALLGEMIDSEGKEVLFEIVKDARKQEDAISNSFITTCGGLFIFSRLILESNFLLLINASPLPEIDNLPKINAFLYFLGQKLAGHREILEEVADPGLLVFAGYHSPPLVGPLKQFLQGITAETSSRFLESLSALFPGSIEAIIKEHRGKQVGFNEILNVSSVVLYRLFAARLGKFGDSTWEYLLNHFISRQSEITLGQDCIHVTLSRKPLDIILRMSGLLEDVGGVPWLDNRRLEFTLER